MYVYCSSRDFLHFLVPFSDAEAKKEVESTYIHSLARSNAIPRLRTSFRHLPLFLLPHFPFRVPLSPVFCSAKLFHFKLTDLFQSVPSLFFTCFFSKKREKKSAEERRKEGGKEVPPLFSGKEREREREEPVKNKLQVGRGRGSEQNRTEQTDASRRRERENSCCVLTALAAERKEGESEEGIPAHMLSVC